MASFEEIYTEYSRKVYRFLLQMTGDVGEAEELLQETFYQALMHIDRFEGRCSLYTWLCQIGKNAWIKEYKRRKRFQSAESEEGIDATLPPDQKVIQKDMAERMRNVILQLEEPYREVTILHVYGELPLKEIAARFGKSESWARVTFHRAKQKVKERLDVEL